MEENAGLSDLFKQLIEQVKSYINLRIDYLKLNVAEYLIKFFSSLVLWLVIFLFLFFVIVFGSFAFAYWFGELTGHWSLGFLIIAVFYIFLAIFIFALRRPLIIKPFTKLIIQHMELDKLNDQDDEKEE